jgi:hypothetical protein
MKGIDKQIGLITMEKISAYNCRLLLLVLLFSCPLMVFSGTGNVNTLFSIKTIKINSDRLPFILSIPNSINRDSLPPFSQVKEVPVPYLNVKVPASYQAIGIDTVISLFPKPNAVSADLPVQELYTGKKLKVIFYHDKVAGKLTLQSDEPMLEIIIYNDRAEEVYTAVSVNNHHKIPLATYKKGRYSIFITGARSRSVQFFFQQSE